MKDIKNFIAETNESIPQKRMINEGLNKTKTVIDTVTDAATALADEYVEQQKRHNKEDESDNYWVDLQQELRSALLDAALKVCAGY